MHPVLPSGQRPRIARHQLCSIPDKGWELCFSAARDTSNVSIHTIFPDDSSPAGGPRVPGVPGLLCGHPDVSPAPGLSLPRLPRPQAAPTVAGLRGLRGGLALVAHTRVGCGDCSTRLQKVFPPLFRLMVFTLLKKKLPFSKIYDEELFVSILNKYKWVHFITGRLQHHLFPAADAFMH